MKKRGEGINILKMKKARKKLLLHICCAPDATYGIEKFSKDYDITLYFYNPNIHPEIEYRLRALELKRLARTLKVPLIEGPYEPERWFEAVKGLEDEPEGGKRCEVCFRMRLEDTASLAKEQGFDAISTVLTISPKKDAEKINRIGKEVAEKYGVKWIAEDLKKRGGFQRSLELSARYGIYRQDYCGCIFSKKEVETKRREREEEILSLARADRMPLKGRPPGSKEELFFLKEARMALEDLGYASAEYSFTFLGWDPLKVEVEIENDAHRAYPLPYSVSIRGVLKSRVEEKGKYMLPPGIPFVRFRTTKGNLEIFVREDGPAIPFKASSPEFPAPKIVLGLEALEPLRQGARIKAQLVAEIKPMTSEVLLTPLGDDPEILLTATLDSPYFTVAESEAASAAVLLQIAGRLRRRRLRHRILLAFSGAESLGLGSAYLEELLTELNLRERIKYRIDVKNVGRGAKLHVRAPEGYDELLSRIDPAAEVLTDRASGGIPAFEVRLWPDELYRTELDTDETLDSPKIAKVVRFIISLAENLP